MLFGRRLKCRKSNLEVYTLLRSCNFKEVLSWNKTELIASVAQKTELTKKDAEKAVKAVFDTVAQELAAGGKVQVIGFGTFEVRERAAREGRNPQNGKTITIAASKSPAFKAGKGLKEQVNAAKAKKRKK